LLRFGFRLAALPFHKILTFVPARVMHANSQPVHSTQTNVHPDIDALVRRHFGTTFAKPIAAHTQEAFDGVNAAVCAWNRSVILDSCCGTGESTIRLAQMFGDCTVIGVDKSAHRIGKASEPIIFSTTPALPDNARIVRADVIDFWRLANEAQKAGRWTIEQHYLLYPNPYPKPHHIKQRWHGHAIFPTLLALAPRLELRTNWRLYAEEFCQAASVAVSVAAGIHPIANPVSIIKLSLDEYHPTEATMMTAFERKYARSGHRLYRALLTHL
jgi:tRNA (guanine-N7-)-methyltransferase